MDGQFNVGGVQSAPQIVLVDDVVMDERPGVVDLDRGGGIECAVRESPERAAGPEQKRGADAFPPVNRIRPDGGSKTLRRNAGRKCIFRDGLRNELKDAELLIIGADDKQYEEFLRKEVERLHLNNVRFTGFLTGKEKDEAIMSLSYLVVPSDFENFGNIVTEALVRGVPVIASKGMPWQELEDYHCGWWIDNDQDTINRTMIKAYETSEIDRVQMGMNGKRLMREKYDVDVLGLKMKQLYEWVLNGGEKPDFVYLKD